MKECAKCAKMIDDIAIFCPYCGSKYETQRVKTEDIEAPLKMVESRKSISATFWALFVIFLGFIIMYGTFCINRISESQKYFFDNRYYQASNCLKYVPSFGNTDVIKLKSASSMDAGYGNYALYKKRCLEGANPSNYKDWDNYRTAFSNLIQAYMGNKASMYTYDKDYEVELSSYFVNLELNALRKDFGMTDNEIDSLVEKITSLQSIYDDPNELSEAQRKETNIWLGSNFF